MFIWLAQNCLGNWCRLYRWGEEALPLMDRDFPPPLHAARGLISIPGKARGRRRDCKGINLWEVVSSFQGEWLFNWKQVGSLRKLTFSWTARTSFEGLQVGYSGGSLIIMSPNNNLLMTGSLTWRSSLASAESQNSTNPFGAGYPLCLLVGVQYQSSPVACHGNFVKS